MPSVRMFARTTITAAFQRMNARMRRSTNSSPGNHGSSSAGMVFTYGVDTVAGNSTWRVRARSNSFINRYRARVRPRVSTTASKESSHSVVSPGSMSGTWCDTPSKSTGPRYPSDQSVRHFRGCGNVVQQAAMTAPETAGDPVVVYTDGSCLGNPGRGGWGWAVPDGPFASGADPQTT